jgi:FkbM family methyltransferase
MPSAFSEARRKLAKSMVLARVPEYRSALRHRVAAGVEHRHVAFEHEARSVIDVGANKGQFALFALHRFPAAVVHCFEPVPVARAVLEAVLAGNPRAVLHGEALGSAAEVSSMTITASDDSSSFLPPGDLLQDTYPGTRPVSALSVEVERLDSRFAADELPRPCLLKIDVQGYEAEVIAGATGLLPAVDEILVECSFTELYEGQPLVDDLVAALRDQGFRLRGVFGLTHDAAGACLQADLLLTRSPGS